MKIIAIRLKNLTSIEGSVEIDFTVEPLRSAGIFAISGPTGAGKSTLLDAMCLALYDKAPRFSSSMENINLIDVGDNQVSQSDVRNLLRRGMIEGYAEVDFEGVDKHRYRSRWSVRRTRNVVNGSLRPQTIEVKDLDTDEELQGNKTELLAQLVKLIGLTYDQFTRTVLLAQNDFTTFLKAKSPAKAELLEKLTGTDIYSRISQEIYAKNKKVQEEIAVIEGQIGVIKLLTDEEESALLNEKKQLAVKKKNGEEKLTKLNGQLSIIQSLQKQEQLKEEKQKDEQKEQALLTKSKSDLAAHEENIAKFKANWIAIQPDLKRARQLDEQIKTQQDGYKQSKQVLETSQQQVKEQNQKIDVADKQVKLSYATLRRLLTIDEGQTIEFTQVEAILTKEKEALDSQVDVNDKRRTQLNKFGYQALTEEQTKLQKELSRQQNLKVLTDGQTKLVQEIADLEKEVSLTASNLSKQKAVKEKLGELYESARIAVTKDVETLRSQLQEGSECPVCGSIEHPYHQSGVVDKIFNKVKQEYDDANATYEKINNQSIASARDLEHKKASDIQLKSQIEALQKEAIDAGDVEQIQKRLKELSASIKEYNQLNEEWQKDDAEIQKIRKHYEELRDAVSQYQLIQQKLEGIKEQLKIVQKTNSEEQQRYDVKSKALEELRKERSLLLKGKNADDAEAAVAAKEKELTLTLENMRKEMEAIQNRLSVLQGEMKQLSSAIEELNAQKNDIVNPEQLPSIIDKQKEENLEIEHNLSSIDVRLLQQKENKKAKEEIAQKLGEKQGIAERWSKLNKLIGSADGTRFKVIAQRYTLNLLLLHANQQLSYLSKRYKLQQIPNSLGLEVIDCDMCDETRTINSLSGGESFLVSLALALGLSSLSSNNLKVESLFIDEGFGSLDADTLRTAMEALEQLQIQGRKIGVISHVQEMSERITVQIQVHKKVNGKSTLTVVG